MKTYMYDSGVAKLAAQDGQGYKLNFTGFVLSDTDTYVPVASDNTLPGNVVYTGAPANMRYIPITNDQVLLQCIVTREVAQITIGAVQLFVDDAPFCVSVATDKFIKLERVLEETVGTRFMYQLLIDIPQLQDRISFVNLAQNVVRFKAVAEDESLVRWPWEESNDQLFVDLHTGINRPIPILNAWNRYWACPLMAEMDNDNMFWKISGGQAGDGHRYASEE